MPTSAAEGRDWVYERIKRTTTPTIYDVGPGEGTYSILGRHLRLDAEWIGVEIYEPYIERFNLLEKYDEILVKNVLDVEWPKDRPFTVLLGDVIEHMPYWQAYNLIATLQERADEIMVSLPIIDSPQGAVNGNEHEAHVHQWAFEDMEALLPTAESWRGEILGRFWWRA